MKRNLLFHIKINRSGQVYDSHSWGRTEREALVFCCRRVDTFLGNKPGTTIKRVDAGDCDCVIKLVRDE